jgi:hypothetical protein
MLKQAGIVAFLLLGLAQPALAQKADVDVSRLPVNFERLERDLRTSSSTEQHDGLNLRYVLQVFGQAPPIIIWRKEDNLVHGPVPYGAPTHREIMEHITPQEYRAPAADLSALFRWLQERAKR